MRQPGSICKAVQSRAQSSGSESLSCPQGALTRVAPNSFGALSIERPLLTSDLCLCLKLSRSGAHRALSSCLRATRTKALTQWTTPLSEGFSTGGKLFWTPLPNEGRTERTSWGIHKASTRKRSLKADFDILWPEAITAAALTLWGRLGGSG